MFPCPRAFGPENLISQDVFGSPVPRQPAPLHTQTESGAYLRDSSRFPMRCPFIYLNRHTPSGQYRVYHVVTHILLRLLLLLLVEPGHHRMSMLPSASMHGGRATGESYMQQTSGLGRTLSPRLTLSSTKTTIYTITCINTVTGIN